MPSGTLWAICNVGASTPESYGFAFAWVETTPKDTYGYETYKWYDTKNKKIVKYCIADSLTTLLPEDDAATANWGEKWHMPTLEEIYELYEKCQYEWTTRNGVNGHKFTGKNGNSIFIPAEGVSYYSEINQRGEYGTIWSSQQYQDYDNYSYYLTFSKDGKCWHGYVERFYGFSVRPVSVK